MLGSDITFANGQVVLRVSDMELMDTNQQCEICLMDKSAEGSPAKSGGCNFCLNAAQTHSLPIKRSDLEELLQRISEEKGEYKAVVGISGGVDSSFVAHFLEQKGIKVLLVHMDNGWNSHLATSNIKKIVSGTRHDFMSYILYWPELRECKGFFFCRCD